MPSLFLLTNRVRKVGPEDSPGDIIVRDRHVCVPGAILQSLGCLLGFFQRGGVVRISVTRLFNDELHSKL